MPNPAKEERAVMKAAKEIGFVIDPNHVSVEENALRTLYDEAWSAGFALGVGEYDWPTTGAH